MRIKFVSIGLSLVLAPTAFAQTVVEAISPNGRNIVQYLATEPNAPILVAEAEKIRDAVLADGIIDEGERQLTDALMIGQMVRLEDEAEETPDIVLPRRATDDAKAVLARIEDAEEDPLAGLWLKGTPESLQKLFGQMEDDEELAEDPVLLMLQKRLERIEASSQGPGDFHRALDIELSKWESRCYSAAGSDYYRCLDLVLEALSRFGEDAKRLYGGPPTQAYERFSD